MAPGRASKRVKSTTTTSTELSAAAQLDSASDYSQPSLALVDSTLRCPICTELFAAPVILTTCSHSFDSRCLREYLVGHKRCPSCLRECTEDNIRLNLALQGAVAAWKDARAALLHLQSLASSSAQAGPSSPSPAARPPPPTATRSVVSGKRKASALASSSSSSPAVKSEPHEPAALVLVDDGSSDVEIIEEGTAPSSTARRVPPRKKARGADGREARGAGGGPGKGKGRARLEEADPTDPSLILECPLCGGSIKNAMMALHVERCNGVPPPATATTSAAWGKLLGANGRGGGARDGDSDSSSTDVREGSKLDTTRPLPLASYARKSVLELNDMLKAYDLPTTLPSSSSRDAPALSTDAKLALLVRRHRQFLVLWNANADLTPDDPAHKSAQGVRDELRRWEKTQGAAVSGTGAGGGASAQAGSSEFSAKAHLKQYADDFRELVAQARASALAARQPRQQAEPAQAEDDTMQVDVEEGARAQPAAAAAAQPVAATTSTSARAALAAGDAGATAPRRTVRIVSPPPRSPPSPAASPSPRARTPSSSSSSPPPPLALSHDLDSPTARPSTSRSGRTSQRSPSRSSSPFAAARPPRASQRNREEERMLAEMEAAREEAEARAAAARGGVEEGPESEDEGKGARAMA